MQVWLTAHLLTFLSQWAIWGRLSAKGNCAISTKERIEELWLGRVPLNVTFWHFAVLYGLLLNAATSMLFMYLLTSDAGLPILLASFLLPIPYNIFVIVAVWRSAGRYSGPAQWVDWARFGTVLWMVVLTAS